MEVIGRAHSSTPPLLPPSSPSSRIQRSRGSPSPQWLHWEFTPSTSPETPSKYHPSFVFKLPFGLTPLSYAPHPARNIERILSYLSCESQNTILLNPKYPLCQLFEGQAQSHSVSYFILSMWSDSQSHPLGEGS